MDNRTNMYSFLSRIYLLEVDGELLDSMKTLKFPDDVENESLSDGYSLLDKYLKAADETSLEELAVDYARIFLAAGVAQGLAAFPYESIYSGSRRLMAQESSSEVSALYAAHGLLPNPESFNTPSDHIGLELGFMAHLCQQGDSLQKDFFNNHLLNWHKGFCGDVEKYAHTDFYKGMAKITLGFLELERRGFYGN